MRKVYLQVILGGIFLLLGLFLFVFYIYQLTLNKDFVFIPIIGIICILAGIFMLFVARKSQRALLAKLQEQKETTANSPEQKTLLIEKQNQLYNDWDKITKTRDKLKMLKISAAAGETS